MSEDRFLRLFMQAQKNEQAPYYVVSFDVVNCKSLTDDENYVMHIYIDIIMKYVYKKLLESEKVLNKQVVVKEERWIRGWKEIPIPNPIPMLENTIVPTPALVEYRMSFTKDPYVFGDCFQFTVLRDTVSKDQIVEWVYECKKMLNMNHEFHIADGYYETNEYEEGNTKLYRGYCLQILEKYHKPEVQYELKRIRSKK